MITNYKTYRYTYSIIMAVYNVEEYIDEAIQSLVKQSLNFENHVQLILVDDGSEDDSGEICKKYCEQYPDNVVYVRQENSGVSSARNRGLKLAKGRYLNFMDPDDKLTLDTLGKVSEFFERHYETIDIVTIPMHFFGGKTGVHPLSSKFKGGKIIDVVAEPTMIFFSASSSFTKREVVGTLQFDEALHYAEDGKFMNTILLDKMAYGALADVKYLYRKRDNGISAIDRAGKTKDWYMDSMQHFSKYFIEYSMEKYEEVPLYIQYLVIYDLRWKILRHTVVDTDLTEAEVHESKNLMIELLQYIEDSVILKLPIKPWHKVYILELKYGEDLSQQCVLRELNNQLNLSINHQLISNLRESILAIQVVEIIGNKIVIAGYVEVALAPQMYEIFAEIGGKRIFADMIKRKDKDIKAWDEVIHERSGFKISLDVRDFLEQSIKLHLKIGRSVIRPKIWIDRNVRLYSFMDKSYFVQGGYCVVYTHNAFVVLKNNLKVEFGREYAFYKELVKRGDKRIANYRVFITLLKKLKMKQIWLMMDRVDRADDNAEHLFRYARKQRDYISKYFILGKESSDWERMQSLGNIVEYNSTKHKLLYLLCDRMISSHSADFARHQLGGEGVLLRNLIDFKFDFLQHGIIKDDVSLFLNRYNTAFSTFITSVKEEYESVIEGDYFYDADVVKLTGLARYDALQNEDKKQIMIIPTWQKDVVGPVNPKTGTRAYSPSFKESDYFKTYNRLINDERIIHRAKEKGYEVLFFPHPEIYQQIEDFDKHPQVTFVDKATSYQKILKESSLLITDYSSIAFDFAYMKKPVLYYQWYENHYDKGYFDYETMGMGAVHQEYEALIEDLLKLIEDNCKMEEKYIKRVESFYKYTDKNNCKRIYEVLKNN